MKHQRVKIEYGDADSATEVSDTNPLPIDDAGGSLTVDGTVLTSIQTAVEVLDDAISGTEMQVDIVSDGAGLATAANQLADGHSVALSAVDNAVLDTIDAVLDTIKVDTEAIETAVELIDDAVYVDDAAGFTLGTSKGLALMGFAGAQSVDSGDMAVLASTTAGALHVNLLSQTSDVTIADGGNSITVDGTVTETNSAAILADTAAMDTNLGTVAGAVAAGQMQVDIVADGAGLATAANQLADGHNVTVDNASLTVDLAGNNDVTIDASSIVATEDGPSGGAAVGVPSMAVRDDGLSALTPAEGDYVPLRVGSTGALHVTGGGGGTEYTLGTDTYTEATSIGSIGAVVRKDSGASLVNTDNEITALQVDASGNLRVTGGGGGTEYTQDAAHADPATAATVLMPRDDALSTQETTDGDWTLPRANARGAQWVELDQTNTINVTEASASAILTDTDAMNTNLATIAGAVSTQMQVDIVADGAGLLTTAAHDGALGVAGTADAQVRSVQGIAGMTAVVVDGSAVTQPVSGTVTANLGATDNAVIDVIAAAVGVSTDAVGTTTFYDEDLDETKIEVTDNPTVVIYSIQAFNTTAAPLFLQLWDLDADNVTVGTTKPTNQYVIPGNADSDGAGFINNFPFPKKYTTGFTVACSTDSEGNTAPGAGACIVNIEYVSTA